MQCIQWALGFGSGFPWFITYIPYTVLIRVPVLGMYVLHTVPVLGVASRMQRWENNVLLKPTGLYMWLNPIEASTETLETLAGRCRDLLILWPHKTSLVCKFPGLLKVPCTNLEQSGFFFSLSLPSACMGANFGFHLGNSQDFKPTVC